MTNNRVVLIGEPNVGKSSLLNALVGEKVSIVTNLPGTTRDKISGFTGNFEIFDTPGMHKSNNMLGKHMRKSISAAVAEADVILYVLDAVNFTERDIEKIANYRDRQPVIVAVNKTDRTNFEKLYPRLEKLGELDFVRAIVPVSATTGFNVNILASEIAKLLPNTPAAQDPDIYTSQSIRQMTAEIIRASIITHTRAEVPHGVAVLITKFNERKEITEIHADIICEKASHKPIIIGKGGAMLGKIGEWARLRIEAMLDANVNLQTHLVVRPDWKNDKELLDKLKYTAGAK